jgi:hypothetical protein
MRDKGKAAGCCKDSCGKDKTTAACCGGKCGKDCDKGCCSSKKTETTAKACCDGVLISENYAVHPFASAGK